MIGWPEGILLTFTLLHVVGVWMQTKNRDLHPRNLELTTMKALGLIGVLHWGGFFA